MTTQDGGPAFPVMREYSQFNEDAGKYQDVLLPSGGMTLRDYFASKAMNGLLAQGQFIHYTEVVTQAYAVADAMLKRRGVSA